MDASTKHLYEFGSFRLDTRERLLLRNGERVRLEGKVFETLVVLVQRSGRLVRKDELMNQVWPDAIVEENNLEKSISVLRKLLGNGADSKYIETVRGLGYRFAADVRELDEDVSTLVRHESRTSLTIEDEEVDLDANERTQVRLVNLPTATAFLPTRNSKLAIRIGAGLVALLIAGIALSYFFLLKRNRAAALTEQDTVLLADFDNRTGDAVFDGTLKTALAVQLEQSPFLNIFSDARVRETLRYMGRSRDERLTADVAREICERQGLKAMFTGSIASLGSDYVISLEALNARSGDVIAREQVEAESKEQVIKKLGEAATKLREKLGESLASIQTFDAPIEQATTPSLEALKAYSLGREQHLNGHYLEAIPLLKHATELDPNFALAYAAQSSAYNNTQQSELALETSQKAYELRYRASEREKLYISSSYYNDTTREVDKHIEILELWKQTYPRDFSPRNNLAFQYNNLGLFEKTIDETTGAIRLNPNVAASYSNLARALIGLNRFSESRQVVEQALAKSLESTPLHNSLYVIAFVLHDMASMSKEIAWANGKPDQYFAKDWQARSSEFLGQVREAREFSGRAFELAQQHNLKEIAAQSMIRDSVRDAAFGDCQRAKDEIAKALAMAHDRRTLINAAMTFAVCGEAAQAQASRDELDKRFPKDTLLITIWEPLIQANGEMNRGNAAQAIQLLKATKLYEGAADLQIAYVRGNAYLSLRQRAEAEAEFQRILDHRGWAPLSPLYPLAQLGLARAAVLTGDPTKARKSYEDFFALWKDADSDIPILIEAKKEYAKLNSRS